MVSGKPPASAKNAEGHPTEGAPCTSCVPTLSPKPVATRVGQPLDSKWARMGQPPLPSSPVAKHDRVCRGCGKSIECGRTNCAKCAVETAKERLLEVAKIGRVAGHSAGAIAKEGQTQRQHAKARAAWDTSIQPSWLTAELYLNNIQPLLATISTSAIARRIGVSRWYAAKIRQGYRPHPRHWRELAELVRASIK